MVRCRAASAGWRSESLSSDTDRAGHAEPQDPLYYEP